MISSEERANNLIKLIRKFKIFMMSEDMTYADKVATITFIGSNFFKIMHTYKIDEELYTTAQDELLPAILGMTNEEAIDATFTLLLDYLERVTKVLGKWT